MNNEQDCVVISSAGPVVHSDRGFLLRPSGVTDKTAGTVGLSMHYGTLPPATKITPHYHPYESIAFTVSGSNRVYFGPKLEKFIDLHPGDFIYIPANALHSPENLSADVPSEYILSRAAPDEIILYPETQPATESQ